MAPTQAPDNCNRSSDAPTADPFIEVCMRRDHQPRLPGVAHDHQPRLPGVARDHQPRLPGIAHDQLDPADHLITVPPPPGYRLRAYQPGDTATWVRLHLEAEPYHHVDEALFLREFGADQALLAERQLYLCDAAGQAVATASAWVPQPERPATLGRVHWVAVTPAHQGRGLMRVLIAALLRRFLDLGHSGAYLTTESFRLRAIRGYLGCGFVPELRHDQDRAAWRHIHSQGVPLPAATQAEL